MSDDITITREEANGSGRYVAHVAGFPEPGEMTYLRKSPTLIVVNHTGVPDSLRGKGVAVALARHVIDEARAQGFKIVPVCPFLASQVQKHPEWNDVIEPL